MQIGLVVEGHGEVDAFPVLVRRICYGLFNFYSVQTTRPIRITKSQMLRGGGLEDAVKLARKNNRGEGPVIVLLDADGDCPAELGPRLKKRMVEGVPPGDIAIVIAKVEFETWYLAAAESLSGKRGLQEGLIGPPVPEEIRGAKEWLNRHMVAGGTYSPSVDQAALAAALDLSAARRSPSFERLCREVGRLIEGAKVTIDDSISA